EKGQEERPDAPAEEEEPLRREPAGVDGRLQLVDRAFEGDELRAEREAGRGVVEPPAEAVPAPGVQVAGAERDVPDVGARVRRERGAGRVGEARDALREQDRRLRRLVVLAGGTDQRARALLPERGAERKRRDERAGADADEAQPADPGRDPAGAADLQDLAAVAAARARKATAAELDPVAEPVDRAEVDEGAADLGLPVDDGAERLAAEHGRERRPDQAVELRVLLRPGIGHARPDRPDRPLLRRRPRDR